MSKKNQQDIGLVKNARQKLLSMKSEVISKWGVQGLMQNHALMVG